MTVARSDSTDTDALSSLSRERLLHDAPALVAYLRARLTAGEGARTLHAPFTLAPARPDARQAAVLAPIFVRDGAPHLLFTVRSAALTKHRGEISFPGGSRDSTDGTLGETALREAYEELALAPSSVALLGNLPTVFSVVSNFLVTPYIGWLPDGLPQLTPNPSEVAEVFEAPLATLADPAIYHSEEWTRGGYAHTVHFYDFGAYRIWGLTGYILRMLLELLPA